MIKIFTLVFTILLYRSCKGGIHLGEYPSIQGNTHSVGWTHFRTITQMMDQQLKKHVMSCFHKDIYVGLK